MHKILLLTLALAFASTTQAQSLTYPDMGKFIVTTNAQAILIRAAMNKAYYNMVKANRNDGHGNLIGCPQCDINMTVGIVDAPFDNTTATHMITKQWDVSEGLDCLKVEVGQDVWGANYDDVYGTTVAVDIDPTSAEEWVDVEIPAINTLIEDENELPQACKDKIVTTMCTWWRGVWANGCEWFEQQLCCDLMVLYPNQPEWPWSE